MDPEELRDKIIDCKEFKIKFGTLNGSIDFAEDGSFYNHMSEMGGEWHVDFDTADDEDGPKLNLQYPDHNLEGTFVLEKIFRDYLNKGVVQFKCIKSTGHLLSQTIIKSLSSTPTYQLVFKKGGKGLNLHAKKDHHGGHDVLWATECDAASAMSIIIE